MTRARLFIVHENQTIASQIATFLNNDSRMCVMAVIPSVNEALVSIDKRNCDIMLVSATLPDDGTRRLLKYLRGAYHRWDNSTTSVLSLAAHRHQIGTLPRLREQQVPTKVIITGLADDPQQILTYIAAGASGYILHKESATWVETIQAVYDGKPLVSPAVTAAMMMRLTKLSKLTARFEPQGTRYSLLTEREGEIVRLLADGYSNQTIAESLFIGVGTVKNHVHSILKKLNLRSRKEVGIYWIYMQRKPRHDKLVHRAI
jgi:DNA-binding NarL/FixJ family response regulator